MHLRALGFVGRQKDDPRREFARRGQLSLQFLLHDASEKLVWQRGQDARAVARVGLAAASAAVVHAAEHFLGVNQYLMAPLALDVGDESDAARIVLVARIIEPLLRR